MFEKINSLNVFSFKVISLILLITLYIFVCVFIAGLVLNV
jgi:hypothetical protein